MTKAREVTRWAAWCGAAAGAAALLAGGCTGDADAPAGPSSCGDLLVQTPCFDCLEASCCAEVRACLDDDGDAGCAACIAGDAEACTQAQPALDLYACLLQGCRETCGEGAPAPICDAPKAASAGACVAVGDAADCNPITNAGCDAEAGEVCDFDTGGFRCFPGPNDRELCAACGGDDGFCGPGLSCFRAVTIGISGVAIHGACARACCDDEDCGAGVCTSYVEADGARVGVCLEKGTSK